MVKYTNAKQFLTNNKERNHAIDFLKFLCILSVIISHACCPATPKVWDLGRQWWCPLNVPLFLLISGYTWYFSCQKQTEDNASNLHKLYNPFYLLKKFLRFFLPWIFAFAAWQIAEGVMTHSFDVKTFFTYFFICGKPAISYGSYFIFIMYQMLIFYPLIYLLVKKYGFKAVIGVFGFLIFFELFVASIKMSDVVYWRLGPRYGVYIAFGAYLAQTKDKKYSFKDWKKDLILLGSFAIGFTSVTLLRYYTSPSTRWLFHYSNTCLTANFLGSLYGIPIAYVYFKKVHIKQPWLGFLGSKTYSIMLCQMIYYVLVPQMWASNNFYLQAFIDILLNVSVGVGYYYIFEKLIAGSTINKLNKWYLNRKKTKYEKE